MHYYSRCKFLEDKNRGLFDRCRLYAEKAGGVPATVSLPAAANVRMSSDAFTGKKVRGTQFRERDYADPNAEMSEDEVRVLLYTGPVLFLVIFGGEIKAGSRNLHRCAVDLLKMADVTEVFLEFPSQESV